ncbi:MAG: DUF3027 domain-containing protein, partial [Kineosporiaceae bacterium]
MPPTSLDDGARTPAAATPVARTRPSRSSARAQQPDAVCAAAVDVARAAAEQDADPGTVGEHLGV